MDPLVISLSCNLEPLIGSLLGWAAGVVAPPGSMTYVGGALVMASTFAVSYAAHMREKRQSTRSEGGLGDEEGGAEGEEAQGLIAAEGRSEAAARKGSSRVGSSAGSELAVMAPAAATGAAAVGPAVPDGAAHAAPALAAAPSWGRMDSWSQPEQSPTEGQRG